MTETHSPHMVNVPISWTSKLLTMLMMMMIEWLSNKLNLQC